MIIEPIATISTPFSDKFTIPRQANIVREAIGIIYFDKAYQQPEALNGLDAHSHYWLTWGFSENETKEKSLTVRPPRLGGNQRVGVFATRSPFRPNNLGLSVVKLESIDAKSFTLTVSGVDMRDCTPIYDIKPYIRYADHINAQSDWASDAPEAVFDVIITPEVEGFLRDYDANCSTRLLPLVRELLAFDARPAYKSGKVDDKTYATTLYNVDIAWRIMGDVVMVIAAEVIDNER